MAAFQVFTYGRFWVFTEGMVIQLRATEQLASIHVWWFVWIDVRGNAVIAQGVVEGI